MEIPFYHDDMINLQLYPSSALSTVSRMMKKDLNLNLAEQVTPHMKPHHHDEEDVLNSPDLGLLKLSSPELERLIRQSNGMVTTATTSNQFLYPKAANDEQEFAEGFVKALEDLHSQNQLGSGMKMSSLSTVVPVQSSMPSSAPDFVNFNGYNGEGMGTMVNYNTEAVHFPPMPYDMGKHHPHLLQHRVHAMKEEPQTVPEMVSFGDSPPMSPIDMDNQERIKAERKRLRNRVAASKCRKRKLERISRLEEKVKSLKIQNTDLASTACLLREQVAQLKQKVMSHVNGGCQLLPNQVHAY
ncbi:transcription factor JunD-like [Spea bombifrons]|uniref:transcription factor JunD-like n=1 Tax=Spea bombifrons TaxID=233779 RepID=UPI00234A2726|nr:transcription factor JunD-like [Spea bombifrons]